jgi:Flp pilus assembly protein TadG
MSNRSQKKRLKSTDQGSSIIEAVLVFPILLWITFGAVEFGHFFYMKHTFQGAAREGARAAAVPGSTNADVTAAVNAAMSAAGVASNKYTTKVRNSTDTADLTINSSTPAGTGILVKVEAVWSDVGLRPSPFISFIPSNKVVRGQTTMRKEG